MGVIRFEFVSWEDKIAVMEENIESAAGGQT
jgi:hypothetical protein